MTLPAYCTNVHPGASLDSVRAALAEHSVAVRRALVEEGAVTSEQPLPIGAWLAAPVAAALRAGEAGGLAALRGWLDAQRLAVTTLNGFPFDDFHTARVKHAVYQPDWTTAARSEHTMALVECAATLGPTEGEVGCRRGFSISTLPLGWPTGPFAQPNPVSALAESARRLIDVVEHASALRDRTGRLIRIDLEPEPGCVLQRSGDVALFAEGALRAEARRRGLSDEKLAEHLGVCLDVCHLAVMFEDPEEFVACVHGAGLTIGKVQVSSAPRCDFQRCDSREGVEALRAMVEERYLHQTMVRLPDRSLRFSDDLPEALAWITPERPPMGEWRVHFHVPVFLQRIGAVEGSGAEDARGMPLGTTRELILPALAAAAADDPVLEVETYAWGVLPPALRREPLARGIAREVISARELIERAAAEQRTRGTHG